MEDRRRFLKVIGTTVLSAGIVPVAQGCSGGGSDGAGGGGGHGAGGAGSVSSSVSARSSDVSSSSSGPPCGVGTLVGKPADYMADGLHQVTTPTGTRVLIGHDAGGFYALSSLCTHSYCDLNTKGTLSAMSIKCGCHGSIYDTVGNVLMGPALKALPAFAMSIGCDGNLYVDTKTMVASSDRFMP